MAVLRGAWDCPFCGRKHIDGPSKFCPSCGVARPANVKFYLPDDAIIVKDEEELKIAHSGPNWICNFCGSDNPSYNKFCPSCGASCDGTKKREVSIQRFDKKDNNNTPPPTEEKANNTSTANSTTKTKVKKKASGIPALIIIGVIFFLIYFFFIKTDTKIVKIKSVHWEKIAKVEVFKTLQKEDWQNQVPSDARVISRERKFKKYKQVQIGSQRKTRTVTKKIQTGTKRVKVGVKDLGNGYFEEVYEDQPVYEDREIEEEYDEPIYRQDPVYDISIKYLIDRWVYDRKEQTTGNNLKPYKYHIKPKERISKLKEKYKVEFITNKGKVLTYNPKTEPIFTSLQLDKKYKVKVTLSGYIKKANAIP